MLQRQKIFSLTIFFLALLIIDGLNTPTQAKQCAKYPVAPRTLSAPAAEYATGKFSIDNEGILVFDYGTAYDNLGKFRNPYFISNYANALYRDYLNTGCEDIKFKQSFLIQADYLINNVDYENGIALWRYPFRNDHFDLEPGWISGIGQARIANVLLRAYGLTGDEKYKEVARDAMKAYLNELTEGGVITVDEEAIWIEEMASRYSPSYKILNGHITALAGILDYARLTQDVQWDNLIKRAIVAIRRDIPKFDAGFTSYYSLHQPGPDRILAPRADYNALHVEQLLWLYDQTQDSQFLEWASRFQAYETISYTFTAKGSVDAQNHGPDQAAALYGSRYWSHADFPTWIQVKLPEQQLISGFWIDGNGFAATPRNYSVDAFVNGEWVTLQRVEDNTKKRQVINFNETVFTDKIKLNIFQDNGNRNTALQAAIPITASPRYAPITNSCNYRIRGSFNYNVNAINDGDFNTGMSVLCPGWVIIPNPERKPNLSIKYTGQPSSTLGIELSNSMDDWQPLGSFNKKQSSNLSIPSNYFIKLHFGKDITSIDEVSFK